MCWIFLRLDDALPTLQSVVERFSEHKTIDDIAEEDDSVESLLVHPAEHWPSHLRDTDMPKSESPMAVFKP